MAKTTEKKAVSMPGYSPILVFGLSGRIGSGCTFVRDKLHQQLAVFGYETIIIDVADSFLQNFDKFLEQGEPACAVGQVASVPLNSPANRVREYQDRGNKLRGAYGDDIIGALCISEGIYPHLEKTNKDLKKRQAFIIDSLKHPSEVDLLRSVFADAFCMVGVVASDRKRKDRLVARKRFSEEDFLELSEIDAEQADNTHGQRTIKAVTRADYFFANDYATKDEITNEAERLLKLVFGIGIQSPRLDEVGMQVAYKSAARSACLSRQVGAAIFDAAGRLISTGHNDVPQACGGLYGPESAGEDKRCWASGDKCYSDEEKRAIVDELMHDFAAAGLFDGEKGGDLKNKIRNTVERSRIRNLIEFTRAVHAEMDAIITVARTAAPGISGSTLYCTTFPCHSCAKHIIDAGIAKVVYLEPYEKSLARRFHGDAINDPFEERDEDKVQFDLYGGVGPARYDAYFLSKPDDRKIDGRFNDKDRQRLTLAPIGAQESGVLWSRIERVAREMETVLKRVDKPPAGTVSVSGQFQKISEIPPVELIVVPRPSSSPPGGNLG